MLTQQGWPQQRGRDGYRGYKQSRSFLIKNFSWKIINERLIYEYKKAISYDK